MDAAAGCHRYVGRGGQGEVFFWGGVGGDRTRKRKSRINHCPPGSRLPQQKRGVRGICTFNGYDDRAHLAANNDAFVEAWLERFCPACGTCP